MRPRNLIATLLAATLAGCGDNSIASAPDSVDAPAAIAPVAQAENAAQDFLARSGFLGFSSVSDRAIGQNRYLVFTTRHKLLPADLNGKEDVYLRDLRTGNLSLISVSSSEVQGNGASSQGSISADGRYVAFRSAATNLVASDTNGVDDIFVRDTFLGTTIRASVDPAGVQANGPSQSPAISNKNGANGPFVVFSTLATNLLPTDTNSASDIFSHDVATGLTRAHSTDSTFAGTANAGSFDPSITPDGSRVCFSTDATNFLTGGLNGNRQIVRVSRATNSVRSLVSQSAGGAQANGNCYEPSISSDGTKVAFFTLASNLGPTDSNGFFDVYLRDVTNNTVSRMSLDSGGGDSNGHSGFPSISGDGSVVAFASLATDLVAGDTNGVFDVFSRTGEVTTRTSLSTAGGEANVDSDLPAISQNGRYIAFRSAATNLITKDALADDDIVIRDQTTPSTFWGTIRCTFPATWPGFAAPINMTAGNAARAVTPGDFNGDGNLDLASTNQSSSNVGIYLGNGSGNFGTPTTYAVGSNPRGISTGDFNHDGDLDLAVSNSGVSNDISILLGDGLGVFVAQTSLTVSGAIWAANGDLNGDGNIDLAVASSGATASVFFGNGTGSFGPATDYALTGQGYSVVDADFDNDGDLDLALVNFSSPGYAAVLLNNGDGTYAARSDYPLAGSGYSLATADMNGDKSLDLVATSTSPSRVAVLLNNGDGTFGTATNYTAGLNPFGVTTGDFDGDGDQDVAVANFSDTFVSLFLNNGDGTLATPTSLTVGTGASSLSAADLDNDGDLDLAVSNQQTNRILVFLNQASP